jgi:hypothetical protein
MQQKDGSGSFKQKQGWWLVSGQSQKGRVQVLGHPLEVEGHLGTNLNIVLSRWLVVKFYHHLAVLNLSQQPQLML